MNDGSINALIPLQRFIDNTKGRPITILIVVGILISHGEQPTLKNIENWTSWDRDTIRKHCGKLIRLGYLTPTISRFGVAEIYTFSEEMMSNLPKFSVGIQQVGMFSSTDQKPFNENDETLTYLKSLPGISAGFEGSVDGYVDNPVDISGASVDISLDDHPELRTYLQDNEVLPVIMPELAFIIDCDLLIAKAYFDHMDTGLSIYRIRLGYAPSIPADCTCDNCHAVKKVINAEKWGTGWHDELDMKQRGEKTKYRILQEKYQPYLSKRCFEDL